MAENQQQPAIRTSLWIGGRLFLRDPSPVQINVKRFESTGVVSNGARRMDRLYTAPGFPNVRNRHDVTLPWPTLNEPDLLQHVDVLQAIGQPFELALWKHVTDVFDGDGETTTFFLQRRQLLPSVTPPTTFPDYPTRIIRLDASYPVGGHTDLAVIQKTTATINTGDPGPEEAWLESEGHMNGALWCSTLRVGTPPIAAPDILLAIYLPLYEVMVESEAPRSYAERLREPRSLKTVEFG